MNRFPLLVPVIEPLDPRRGNVYEHTPLDYYRYGEYPRFLRPVGAHQPRTVTVWNQRELDAALKTIPSQGTKEQP